MNWKTEPHSLSRKNQKDTAQLTLTKDTAPHCRVVAVVQPLFKDAYVFKSLLHFPRNWLPLLRRILGRPIGPTSRPLLRRGHFLPELASSA
eukprot:561291-Rhodomonas_salina.3